MSMVGQVVKGKKIVDEGCKCGHGLKDHGSVMADGAGNPMVTCSQRGQCLLCHCLRFAWDHFEFGEQNAND